MARISAVVFDWGGTLSTRVDVEPLSVWAAAARHLVPTRAEEIELELRAAESRAWSHVDTDQESFSTRQIVGDATGALGLDLADAILDEAATHHVESWMPHIVHEPDAVRTLAALRDEGLGIGLLSNTHWPSAYHEELLARDGLDALIDVRCYTSEMARTKPHPSAFQEVLRRLDVDAADAVFVGDRLFDDIYGAKSVGMRAVLRLQPGMPSYDIEPDAEIDRLSDLLPLLATWM